MREPSFDDLVGTEPTFLSQFRIEESKRFSQALAHDLHARCLELLDRLCRLDRE